MAVMAGRRNACCVKQIGYQYCLNRRLLPRSFAATVDDGNVRVDQISDVNPVYYDHIALVHVFHPSGVRFWRQGHALTYSCRLSRPRS